MFVHPMNAFDSHGNWVHESPTPDVDSTTIRRIPACSSTSHRLAHESARNRGGETWGAKGLSDLRTVLRVVIAAEGGEGVA
jgi:hypothetical protein